MLEHSLSMLCSKSTHVLQQRILYAMFYSKEFSTHVLQHRRSPPPSPAGGVGGGGGARESGGGARWRGVA